MLAGLLFAGKLENKNYCYSKAVISADIYSDNVETVLTVTTLPL